MSDRSREGEGDGSGRGEGEGGGEGVGEEDGGVGVGVGGEVNVGGGALGEAEESRLELPRPPPCGPKQDFFFKCSSYLLFPADCKAATEAIMVFNAIVWIQRGSFFKTAGPADQLSMDQAVRRLARAAHLDFACSTAGRRSSAFGNASTRTPAQKARALEYAGDQLDSVPKGSAVAFTDGSSLGNPGPAGAGGLIYVKGGEAASIDFFAPLGEGGNNLAELWAIGMALDQLRKLPPRRDALRSHHFH
jgi:hypothetical protein